MLISCRASNPTVSSGATGVTAVTRADAVLPSPTPTPKPIGPARISTPEPASTIPFLSMDMLDVSDGWALAFNAILRTTDGGHHWTNVTPHEISLNTSQEVDASFFRSVQEGWIAIGSVNQRSSTRVFHTRDGGKTWTRATLGGSPPAGVTSITFVDPVHGWLMAGGGGAMGSAPAAIYQTHDSGKHWTKEAMVSPEQLEDHGLTFGGDKNGLVFQDQTTGWMTGSTHPGIPTHAWLYVTHDGGQSWHPQQLPIPKALSSTHLVFTEPPLTFTSGLSLLPVGFSAANGDSPFTALFYTSQASGQEWEPMTSIPNLTSPRLVYSFIDATNGWIIAGDKLYHTLDGAHSWTAIKPTPSLRNAFQIDFVTNQMGWALIANDGRDAYSDLLLTTDGGRVWTTLSPRVTK